MDIHRIGFAIVLLLVTVFITVSLLRRSRDAKSLISLDDLLIGDDGRLSKTACVMWGSFVVTSYVVVYQTFKGTLTDMTFGAYITAWVVPAVAKIIKGGGPATPSGDTAA